MSTSNEGPPSIEHESRGPVLPASYKVHMPPGLMEAMSADVETAFVYTPLEHADDRLRVFHSVSGYGSAGWA